MSTPRTLAGAALAAAMRDSRARLRSLVDDLSEVHWQVPQRFGVNPVAWELAHVAWFAEFWILRGPHTVGSDGFVHATRPARHAGPDTLFDSARLPHAARWTTPLPPRAKVERMLEAQLDACLSSLPTDTGDEALYFHRLALLHEDMHAEALAWMRAALGYPAPPGAVLEPLAAAEPLKVRGGRVSIGWPSWRRGFAFDNERRGHTVLLADYEIDAVPVTAGEFLRFVEAGGYAEPACWLGVSGAWRAQVQRSHPGRWRHGPSGWQVRWFDRWLPLVSEQPVIHINAHEAEAYARWAGRRLPSAAEWEHAAERIRWGRSVWEWTADAFVPYPGFSPGPYKDYSAPWFSDHRELRGASFATHERLHDRRYRNFFLPQRCDIFAGFRTARDLSRSLR
jgi:ergothioneine biosynthesis protein EgtB